MSGPAGRLCAGCGGWIHEGRAHVHRCNAREDGSAYLATLPHERFRPERDTAPAFPASAPAMLPVTFRRASLTELVDQSHVEYARSYMRATETWRGVHDDAKAWDIFRRSAPELVGLSHATVAERFFLGRWREQGLPRVVLGPRRAASLMATAVAVDQVEEIAPPWRAFMIEISDSPVSIRAPHALGEEMQAIDRIEVHIASHHTGSDAWSMIAWAKGVSIQRFNVAPREWIDDSLEWVEPTDIYSSECDAVDLRALSTMSRLVAGVCLAMSSRDGREDAERRGRSKGYRQRRRGPMPIRDYVIGDDVRLDVRGAVSDYVARGGKVPSVQCLVRGHWKRQVHGVGRAERKWIQVEPYWRGPEAAPIVTKTHKFSAE